MNDTPNIIGLCTESMPIRLCVALATHSDERRMVSCRQKTPNLTGSLLMPALSRRERGVTLQLLAKLFPSSSPSTSEGKFHLYTLKFSLHKSTVYGFLVFLRLRSIKKGSSFVACLSFRYAYSSLHASSRCCALIDDRSLVLSHHFMIYGLSFGPR